MNYLSLNKNIIEMIAVDAVPYNFLWKFLWNTSSETNLLEITFIPLRFLEAKTYNELFTNTSNLNIK